MIRNFAKNEDGASAVEFALVAPVFFMMLIATMELALKTMMQSELDNVMFQTIMQLSIEEDLKVSKADYKENVVCAKNIVLLDCAQIQFGATAVGNNVNPYSNGFLLRSYVNDWETGCGSSNIIMEFVYPMPNILLNFGIVDAVSFNGAPHMRSRGVARREPVLTGSGSLFGGGSC
mgnify:CR=1 FL=1